MTLNSCSLTLIHIVPVGQTSKITSRPRKRVSHLLTCEVLATQSGHELYYTIMTLVQRHYNLSSTTVTGIPMKEEQNASSSANYDVELLHPADVHTELNRTAEEHGLVTRSKEIPTTSTITLKWCTPKTNNVELHMNTSVRRITPVDVNSRPSSCLTNFLLSGRSVLLEQPCKSGSKLISHMLTSHGGEIFIHALNTARSCLDDPPSISEGCGGRVTDYRITDFGKFMKEHRLVPSTSADSDEIPIEKAISRLEGVTRKWPLTISDTIIHNMASLQPLLSLLSKEQLSQLNVHTCTMAIIETLEMENRNDPLPIGPNSGGRGKGIKREEQYRQMWAELEALIRAHSSISPSHQAILDCLLQCKKPSPTTSNVNKPDEDDGTASVSTKEQNFDATEASWNELDRYQKMTVREWEEFEKTDISSTKKLKSLVDDSAPKPPGGHNLFTLWNNRKNAAHSKRHEEFAGRLATIGNVAELYPHLNEKMDIKKDDILQENTTSNSPSVGPT